MRETTSMKRLATMVAIALTVAATTLGGLGGHLGAPQLQYEGHARILRGLSAIGEAHAQQDKPRYAGALNWFDYGDPRRPDRPADAPPPLPQPPPAPYTPPLPPPPPPPSHT